MKIISPGIHGDGRKKFRNSHTVCMTPTTTWRDSIGSVSTSSCFYKQEISMDAPILRILCRALLEILATLFAIVLYIFKSLQNIYNSIIVKQLFALIKIAFLPAAKSDTVPELLLRTYGVGRAYKGVIRGLTRALNPHNKDDWNKLREQIENEKDGAHYFGERFEQLYENGLEDDVAMAAMTDVSCVTLAVSYKQIPWDVRTRYHDEWPKRRTMTERQWEELRKLAIVECRIRRRRKVRLWIDQVMSARRDRDDVSWVQDGVLPYGLFTLAYVTGGEDVESSVKRDLERVWIKLEHVVGVQCQGILTCADPLEVRDWGADATYVNRHAEVSRILGIGSDPVTALRQLAFHVLTGKFSPKIITWPEDYVKIRYWTYKFAGLAWPVGYEKFLGEGEEGEHFDVSPIRVLENTLIQYPGEIPTLISRKLASAKCRRIGERIPCWDGLAEWVPELHNGLERTAVLDEMVEETVWACARQEWRARTNHIVMLNGSLILSYVRNKRRNPAGFIASKGLINSDLVTGHITGSQRFWPKDFAKIRGFVLDVEKGTEWAVGEVHEVVKVIGEVTDEIVPNQLVQSNQTFLIIGYQTPVRWGGR